ncbi:hypothetical protein BCT23_14075 [Enterovibrio norvegicus]|uniref:Uncharacterized protein n=1 Tax=Enterovibrio norvegicus TaxID=188144 RepID=A0A2N7LBE6_9GAMM|nr:hypothetical protein BCT23_14075 [Enterovibrio norvegicus]
MTATEKRLYFYNEMKNIDISDEVYDYLEDYFLETNNLAHCKKSATIASFLKPKSDNLEKFKIIFLSLISN